MIAASLPTTEARAEDAPLAPTAVTATAPAAPPPMRPRDVGMRTAGQVLTTIGGTSLVVGSGVMIGYGVQQNCEFCGLAGVAFGGPVVLLGVVLTSIGIPLWAVGAAEVPDTAPRAARIDLHVGAGSVGISGSF